MLIIVFNEVRKYKNGRVSYLAKFLGPVGEFLCRIYESGIH